MISIEKLLLKRFIIVATCMTIALGLLNHWWTEKLYMNIQAKQLQHESDALLSPLQNITSNQLAELHLYFPQHSSHLYYIKSNLTSWSSAPDQVANFPIDKWITESGTYQYQNDIGQHYLVSSNVKDDIIFVVIQETTASLRELEKAHSYMLVVVAFSLLLLMYLQRQVIRKTFSKLQLESIQYQIDKVQRGERTKLYAPSISEIAPMVKEINKLLGYLESRNERTKHAAGNLSHALKTPVAVIRQIIEQKDNGLSSESSQKLIEQMDQMNFIINSELKRARISGRGSRNRSFSVADTVDKLSSTLMLIYPEKKVEFIFNIEDEAYFPGDKSDFHELLGNLMDNAVKWCAKNVELEIFLKSGALCINICDDGPGCSNSKIETLLERGVRLDEQTPGHGLGLNIVVNIVKEYSGEIDIYNKEPNGFNVKLQIPLELQ